MSNILNIEYLKKSLRIQNDPVINDWTDEDLEEILDLAVTAHSPLYNIDTLPANERYFVVLKFKEEVYYRLASESAPLYPISAEGAELRKDYRFEHYMSLIRRVEQEYNSLWAKFDSQREVQVGDLTTKGFYYTRRNYNLSSAPEVQILQCIPHTTSIDLEWNKFNCNIELFLKYSVYISNSQITTFDGKLSDEAEKVADITDVHETRFTIKDLVANTPYFITVVHEDRHNLRGFSELKTQTESMQ